MIYHDKRFHDPSHSWTIVPIKRLIKLGIADQISAYSFIRGIYAYLEEDRDLTLYINTLKSKGHGIEFTNSYGKNRSRIRDYNHYHIDKSGCIYSECSCDLFNQK